MRARVRGVFTMLEEVAAFTITLILNLTYGHISIGLSSKTIFKTFPRYLQTFLFQVTSRLENLSCLRLLSQTGERNAVKVKYFWTDLLWMFWHSLAKKVLLTKQIWKIDQTNMNATADCERSSRFILQSQVASLEAGSIKPEQVIKELPASLSSLDFQEKTDF